MSFESLAAGPVRTILIVLASLVIVGFAARWLNARVGAPAQLGVRNGRLSECPGSPNCVVSGTEDAAHRVEPLPLPEGRSLADLRAVVEELGRARLVDERPDYLHFEIRTPGLGFIDDVELLADLPARVVHIRSASRVGYSDLGVNRRRVEEIRRRWNIVSRPR